MRLYSDRRRVVAEVVLSMSLGRAAATLIRQHTPSLLEPSSRLSASHQLIASSSASDPRHGMIYGPAEHDTCDMGTASHGKPATPVVDGQYMLYYFSVSMWSWRGMVELGNLLHDYSAGQDDLARRLLSEAGRFKKDIDRALNSSVVRDESTDKVIFVPCAVVPTGTTAKPYTSMTVDIVASYSNFR